MEGPKGKIRKTGNFSNWTWYVEVNGLNGKTTYDVCGTSSASGTDCNDGSDSIDGDCGTGYIEEGGQDCWWIDDDIELVKSPSGDYATVEFEFTRYL